MNTSRAAKCAFFLVVFLASAWTSIAIAQKKISTIKANSRTIKILDGDDTLTGMITPELNPDVYVYHPTGKRKTVSIITDAERIDFQVKPGETYDYAILLNGKDICNQRITSINPHKVIYKSRRPKGATDCDTIPFTFGPNNAIHIQGTLNGSMPLDLIFDTGAAIGVLSETGRAKGAKLAAGDNNAFELAGIHIEKSPATFIDYRGGLGADGVLGYNAFEGKVVKIDYDANLLTIYDKMPDSAQGYQKTDLLWKEASAFVGVQIHFGEHNYTTLACFDTGSKWSLSLCKKDPFTGQHFDTFPQLGSRQGGMANGTRVANKTVELPSLSLAGITLPRVQADLEVPSQSSGLSFNILGNDFLKRFDVLIDYQQSVVYLKPNHHRSDPYNPVFNPQRLFTTGVLILAGIGMAFGIYRLRRKKSV